MQPVHVGQRAGAARALLPPPQAQLMQLARRLFMEARRADIYRRNLGSNHPRLGDGSLMAVALTYPRDTCASTTSKPYLKALKTLIEAALDQPAAQD